MRRARLAAPPLIAGVLAASAAFAAVAALTGVDDARRPAAPDATARAADPLTAGRAVFARMGCGNCHRLAAANSQGQIGPDLDERLPAHDRRSLVSKIVDPYPDLPADAFPVMPQDYGRAMSPEELDALVAFLLAARRPDSP